MRINKFISETGICSRRNADNLIDEKRVKINGKIVNEKGVFVDIEKDVVEIDNKKISINKNKRYIMLNKPKGYITTVKEQFNRPCVMDLIENNLRLYPVGRLDMDTSGLLILTNDGDFANKITHPKNHIRKTYEVETNNNISDKDIENLEKGVDIGGYITKPSIIKRLGKNKINIVISEGKNRQVRKMLEAVNNKVVNLKRTKIGNLSLGNLKIGSYRDINKEELNKIFE